MNTPKTSAPEKSWFWPWCVVGLLAANMGVVGATISFALRDPPIVDPTYDAHTRTIQPKHEGARRSSTP